MKKEVKRRILYGNNIRVPHINHLKIYDIYFNLIFLIKSLVKYKIVVIHPHILKFSNEIIQPISNLNNWFKFW